MIPTRVLLFFLLAPATVVQLCAFAGAAEVHSNGLGGGAWSDPTTWEAGAVPGPQDTAVITSGDAVVFDQDDDARSSCKDLYVDPDGALTFKPGGKRVLVLEGPIESYGMIKLDASADAEDSIEIRFTGPTEQRTLKLAAGGALLALGRPNLPAGRRNVILRSSPTPVVPPAPDAPPPPPVPALEQLATITVGAGMSLDLQNAHLDGVNVQADNVDNTGAKPNERLNITGCLFTRAGWVGLAACDTPQVVGNSFEYDGPPIAVSAITMNHGALAAVRGNSVTGKYTYGIYGYAQVDSYIADNTLTQCVGGIHWDGKNGMLKGNTIRACTVGTIVNSGMTGAMVDTVFDGCTTALNADDGTVQATNIRFINTPQDGVRVRFRRGALTLVNCEIAPEEIISAPEAVATPTPRVESMQFLVVAVKGEAPPGVLVDVTSAVPPAPGAFDMNVRNTPAPVSGGLTPLPSTLKPLILKSWVIQGDGAVTPPQPYNVNVVVMEKPAVPEGAADVEAKPKLLKSVPTTPAASWYRAKPNDPTPTLEVTLP